MSVLLHFHIQLKELRPRLGQLSKPVPLFQLFLIFFLRFFLPLEFLKSDIPEFDSGDTVAVDVKVREGNKERVQRYEGVVGSRHGRKSLDASFTVRKVTNGVGVERIFPLHSPMIASIDVKRRGKVRRAKLNYLRNVTGSKAARIEEKR